MAPTQFIYDETAGDAHGKQGRFMLKCAHDPTRITCSRHPLSESSFRNRPNSRLRALIHVPPPEGPDYLGAASLLLPEGGLVLPPPVQGPLELVEVAGLDVSAPYLRALPELEVVVLAALNPIAGQGASPCH